MATETSTGQPQQIVSQPISNGFQPASATSFPGQAHKPQAAPYGFRRAGAIPPTRLRALRQRHQEFVCFLASQLSVHFRLEFKLSLTDLTLIPYGGFAAALPDLTHI